MDIMCVAAEILMFKGCQISTNTLLWMDSKKETPALNCVSKSRAELVAFCREIPEKFSSV